MYYVLRVELSGAGREVCILYVLVGIGRDLGTSQSRHCGFPCPLMAIFCV